MNPLPWRRPNATEAYGTERLGSRDHDLAFPWASRIDIARLAAMQAAVQQLWQRYDLPYFAEENSTWQKDLNALLLAAAGQRLNSRCYWRTPLSLCRQLLAGLAWAISCRSPVLEVLSVWPQAQTRLIWFATNYGDDKISHFRGLPIAVQVGVGLHLAALAALVGDV